MTVITNLPRQTEDEIRRLVESGDFENGTDVVVQAVHYLVEQKKRAEHLRKLLQVSIDQYERGEYRELTQELLDERWELALERYRSEHGEDARATS
ncbi:MAG: hypothetical protein WKF63_08310 [Thermomicrobiales bacterium]